MYTTPLRTQMAHLFIMLLTEEERGGRHPSCCFFVFCFSLHQQHEEVPEPGLEPIPQQWTKPLQWQYQIFNLLSHTGDPCCCFFVLFHFVILSLVSVNYYHAYYLIFAFKNFSAHISLLNMFIRTGKRALKIAILHLRKLRFTIEKWFDKSL